MKIKSYIRLLRPVNCFLAGLATLIGAKIALFGAAEISEGMIFDIFLAFLTTFIICGAGNAVNDFFDYEIDKKSKAYRPLPSGEISLSSARIYFTMLFFSGVALSSLINIFAFLLAFFNAAMLYYYASIFKRKGGISKNLIVSYLVASPFIYGSISAISLKLSGAILLAFLAMLANVAREIAKDIEDMHADAAFLESLPIKYGVDKASFIAAFFVFLAVSLSLTPYHFGFMSLAYVFIVAIADLIFLISAGMLIFKKEKARESQTLMKLAMFFALLAFIAGSFSF